jgi:hypothetical protein
MRISMVGSEADAGSSIGGTTRNAERSGTGATRGTDGETVDNLRSSSRVVIGAAG